MKKRSRQMPKKVMGFFGTREGAGCTHMALSVANYLHSVEKWEVMYLELGDFSHLYPMFSDRVVEKRRYPLCLSRGILSDLSQGERGFTPIGCFRRDDGH